MKAKIKKLWSKVKKPFQKQSQEKYIYPIEIPLAGIRNEHVRIDPEGGYMIIEADQQIVVEEAERYSPAKMYNSFGFSRSIFLPRGINIKFIQTKIDRDRLIIGWPEQMYNQ